MFSTHLNWQLTWRWKSFLAQQYSASIAVIVSGAENVEWALDEACRAYPMMVDIPYMIQVPGTPPRSPCVLHVSFTPYTSIAYFAQDDWLWHAPVILSPSTSGGACEMGRWARSHNAPISALYRHSPDSVRRNQAIVDTSLWPRGARSDVGSSVFRSILHHRISRAKVLSGRAGYLEQARRWEWWYKSSMTNNEKGDLNLNMKTNLKSVSEPLGTGNLKLPILGNIEQLML